MEDFQKKLNCFIRCSVIDSFFFATRLMDGDFLSVKNYALSRLTEGGLSHVRSMGYLNRYGNSG